MAYLIRENKRADLMAGPYRCTIVHFESTGKKVTKNKQVFEQGYLYMELEDGTLVKQYVLITPWRTFFFYKLLKAIDSQINVEEVYLDFSFHQIINTEVVIEISYEINANYFYPNITAIYNLDDGEAILEFHSLQEERKIQEGQINMGYIERMNERRLEGENQSENNEELEACENQLVLGNEYEEFIGI